MNLVDYVMAHSERGACLCGKCADAVFDPADRQPVGHTADVVFFQVSAKDADANTLKELVKAHHGDYCQVDLFDGQEHGYMELGAWIGDQGLAMQLMGLGAILGLWNLLTPKSMLGKFVNDDLAMKMAGMGMVTIQVGGGTSQAQKAVAA
jgi:hypothetical protein